MEKGVDYRITKLEKGPLQRFKNQNTILKKFGEVGLQIYKSITGKRTSEELKKDLAIEDNIFYSALALMEENEMIKLEPASGSAARESSTGEEAAEEAQPEEDAAELEELPPAEEEAAEEAPLEEELPSKPSRKKKALKREEVPSSIPDEEEIKPILFEEPEEPEPEKKRKSGRWEEEREEEPPDDEEAHSDEEAGRESEEEPAPEEGTLPEEEKARAEDEMELEGLDEERPPEEESGLSPVEKIIKDKYGDTGLRVYALIDGQRTAEQIMNDTGLTESRLVEILDFMDEQGIIKLDYPKGRPPPAAGGRMQPPPPREKAGSTSFNPMIEGDEALDEAKGVLSPIEIPVKAPLDLVKSVQMKANTMLKFGNRGTRVLDEVNGKNDMIDIALRLDIPMYEISNIILFLLNGGYIIMKSLSRTDVRKKYGDDGYSVYKRYGKEGLMLYQLIGKDLTIRQMADKITKDRAMIIEMFIFIQQVLGIELPIDKDVLAKELEVK